MRILLVLASMISFVIAIFLIYLCLGDSISIGFRGVDYLVNVPLLLGSLFALGFTDAACSLSQSYFTESKKVGAYKRELEKKSIDSSSNSSKVDVLEAKIKVLEKALDDALNK